MKYTEVDFTLTPLEPARDILICQLGELGYESMLETPVGVKAYIDSSLFDKKKVEGLIQDYPDFSIAFSAEDNAEQNWNAEWEKNFEPIIVTDKCAIRAPFHDAIVGVEHEVVISPKMSFGTGHHETTYQMVEQLSEMDLVSKSVCDMGTGTGVLAIYAEKIGAKELLGVDIEEWAFKVPAIIQAWAPTDESSVKIARVIFGDSNPGGKMPFRWTMNKNQNFNTRYSYGHGLSYTTFGIGKLLTRRNRDGSGWIATVEVKNVGSRTGTEILQLYVIDPNGNSNNENDLKAFKGVTLKPGEKKIVSINVPYEAFTYYSPEKKEWIIDPGLYEVMVGISAEEIKLRKTIEIKKSHLNL